MAKDSTRWIGVGTLVLVGHLGAFASLHAWFPEVPATIVGQTGVVTATISIEQGASAPLVSSQPAVKAVAPEPQPVLETLEDVKPLVKEAVNTIPVQKVKQQDKTKPKETQKPPVTPKVKETPKTVKAKENKAPASATPVTNNNVVKETTSGTPDASGVVTSQGSPIHDYVGPSASADYLKNPHPKYPKASLRRGEAGTVLLALTVTADGKAKDVRVIKSSGYPRLDKAALEAVAAWRFVPAKRLGHPVDADYELPIHFKLKQ